MACPAISDMEKPKRRKLVLRRFAHSLQVLNEPTELKPSPPLPAHGTAPLSAVAAGRCDGRATHWATSTATSSTNIAATAKSTSCKDRPDTRMVPQNWHVNSRPLTARPQRGHVFSCI